MSLLTWAVITALILINALYVAAEFASVSVRRSRIQQQAEAGDALARRLLPVLADPHRLDRYIAACQIGITISSLVVGAYGQATLAVEIVPLFERFGRLQGAAAQSTAALVVLAALTVLQMVLGELVPKSLALQAPTRVARLTVIPMQWSVRLLSGFTTVLNGSGSLLLRLVGVADAGHRHIHSPEEIEYLIVESRDGGALEPDESVRLRHALQLSIRPVGELMVPRTKIEALDVTSTQAEVLEAVRETPYTRLPVYDETIDHVIGVVHARDVAVHAAVHRPVTAGGGRAGAPHFDLRAIMRPVLIVPETLTADQLLARMRAERRTMAVVADEFGGTAGLVTVDDILDELLGDMGDEFKTAGPAPERLPDGRVRIPGGLRLDEAARWVGAEWEGDAYTVAGRVLEAMGRVPTPGERVVIDGAQVEVERVRRHAIETVLVTPARRRTDDDEADGGP